MKIKLLHILDFFFVLRPTLFFPVWTISLAGLWAQRRYAAVTSDGIFKLSIGSVDISVFVMLLFLTSVMAAAFLLNQITDVESDRLNDKLYLLANGTISTRQAYFEILLLVSFPLVGLYLLRRDMAVVALFAFIITGWIYSCRPLLLENKPWGGMLTNLVGALTIFSYGWMIQGGPSILMIYRAIPYLLGILAIYFLTTIPDVRGDAAVKKVTIAVHWGQQRVFTLAFITHMLAIIAACVMQDWVVLAPLLLVFYFFVLTFRQKTVSAALRTNKFAALFLSLMICIQFPVYLILIAMLFFFCKWYYAVRFNMKYPSLHL